MGSRRRQLGEIRHQEMKMTRSRNRKPPLGSGCYVPSWEKQFCFFVGSVPWRKVLDTKKYMYLYDNIVKWDDSAGEEAFHNAKNRFWAKLNGLPCNISLPDPDIYIDEVDWDSSIDPDLFLDLERETNLPINENENEILSSLGNAIGLNESFWCTGWGEAEEVHKDRDLNNVDNQWERGWSRNYGEEWNNCWNALSGHNDWENQNNEWGYTYNLWEDGVRDEAWKTGVDAGCRQLDLNSWNKDSNWYNYESSINDRRNGNTWGMNRSEKKVVNFSDGPYRPVSQRVYGNGNRWS